MKKIDFHMHTVSTPSDREFIFSLDKLKEYVSDTGLDAVAITNHNMFDKEQFISIKNELKIKVFPGIEINLEETHLLLIAEDDDLVDFDTRCKKISEHIPRSKDWITVEQLGEVFVDLSKYLLIPHYKKSPDIESSTYNKLKEHVFAGEVCAPKKFVHCLKRDEDLVPVLFSDLRMEEKLKKFTSRQTYIDVGEISLNSLKKALKDKSKVFLSEKDGHNFFNVLNNKVTLSTGLNVILGERSTGKSYTLNLIADEYDSNDTSVKYIKQFSLLQKDDEDEKDFSNRLTDTHSVITKDYLSELEGVLKSLHKVDIEQSKRQVGDFISSLQKHASESDRLDSFSKAKLFTESKYSINELEPLKKLIKATMVIADSNEYQDIVDKFLSKDKAFSLVSELIKKYNELRELELKKVYVNGIIEEVKDELSFHTAATIVDDVDLYQVAMNHEKVKKFNDLFAILKNESVFYKEEIQGFTKIAKRSAFLNASDLKAVLRKVMSFSNAYEEYSSTGYEYLKQLRDIDSLREVDYYKHFAKVSYEVLNSDGYNVSGGERSEFRLLQDIKDASRYDILLIDEPESSFDNMFLFSRVNKLIKEISQNMPVVIVTHNSTVGASIKPDYILYTRKTSQGGDVEYEVFSGYPGDKELISKEGNIISNHRVLLDCLEAGDDPYKERREDYEGLEDRKR